jgi:hypothetical protein
MQGGPKCAWRQARRRMVPSCRLVHARAFKAHIRSSRHDSRGNSRALRDKGLTLMVRKFGITCRNTIPWWHDTPLTRTPTSRCIYARHNVRASSRVSCRPALHTAIPLLPTWHIGQNAPLRMDGTCIILMFSKRKNNTVVYCNCSIKNVRGTYCTFLCFCMFLTVI